MPAPVRIAPVPETETYASLSRPLLVSAAMASLAAAAAVPAAVPAADGDDDDGIRRTHSAPESLASADEQSQLHHRLPRTSKYGAALMLFKAIVGAGLFALPYATELTGIGGAVLAMFACGWLCYYSSHALVRVHDVVVADTLQRNLTYVSLARYCFGENIARATYFLMVFTGLGSLGAYLVLIGNSLHSVWPSISSEVFSAITALVVTPFCLVKSSTFLSVTSVIGNVGVIVVIIAVLVQGALVTPGIGPASSYTPYFRTDTFPQAFGIFGFVWACATTTLTVEKSMENRREFAAAYQMATWAVFLLCTGFGIVNFLYFGPSTCSIIVLNLGTSTLATVAKVAIALDLGFSYPLAFAPSREIVEKSLLTDTSRFLEAKRMGLRIAMIVLTWCLCFFPDFGVILNIVGGWSASVLSFILPPLLLLQVRRFHSQALSAQVAHDAEAAAAEAAAARGGGGAKNAVLALGHQLRAQHEAREQKRREKAQAVSVGVVDDRAAAAATPAGPSGIRLGLSIDGDELEEGGPEGSPEGSDGSASVHAPIAFHPVTGALQVLAGFTFSRAGAVLWHAHPAKPAAGFGSRAVSLDQGLQQLGEASAAADVAKAAAKAKAAAAAAAAAATPSSTPSTTSFTATPGLRRPHSETDLLSASAALAASASVAVAASTPQTHHPHLNAHPQPHHETHHAHGLGQAHAHELAQPVYKHAGHAHAAHLSAYFMHLPHRSRHERALERLGVGSAAETVLLLAVALFGVCVFVFTTVSSLQSLFGVNATPQPAICTG